MALPNTPAPSSASAIVAAQVFAIPELLEHILIKLADKVSEHEVHHALAPSNRSSEFKLEPATTVALCHMVSRDFHYTIKGSTKLKRLTEFASSRDGEDQPTKALGWLFQTQLKLRFQDLLPLGLVPSLRKGRRVPRYKTRPEGIQDVPHALAFGQPRRAIYEPEDQLVKFEMEKGHREASWRQVKLCRTSAEFPIEFARESVDRTHHCVDAAIRGDTTLGIAFDGYRSQMQEKAARALAREPASSNSSQTWLKSKLGRR